MNQLDDLGFLLERVNLLRHKTLLVLMGIPKYGQEVGIDGKRIES